MLLQCSADRVEHDLLRFGKGPAVAHSRRGAVSAAEGASIVVTGVIHFPSGEYSRTMTLAAHSATQPKRGRSVSSIAAGLPPPRFWCTR